ncbi:amidohydrolase [Streptomyces sp. NPDC059256]|uniref:amidohydrolase n=1 Tax=Streptomyces sp. NPDC059256 TaxID=3346794 RepID=UPI0036BD0E6D
MSPELSRRRLLVSAGGLGAAAALAPATTASAVSWPKRHSAAYVVHNAKVLTGGNTTRTAEAIAVGRDGKVIATGPSGVIRKLVGRDTEVINASGGTVMNGIVDGHAHPLEAGARSLNPSLHHQEVTVPQLQEILKGFLADSASKEPDGWLVVEDWNPIGLLPTGTVPSLSILDALPTRRPIALIGNDGHNTWANRRALAIAGVTASTPDPAGGQIVHGPDGSPTGLLKDEAQGLVRRHIPEATEEQLLNACATTLAYAASQGITTFMDAVVGDWELKTYAALAASRRLPQRVVPALRLSADQAKDPAAALKYVKDLRKKYGGVNRLYFGTVKAFLDGVIEYPAQTAALLAPYLDEQGKPTGNRGDLYSTSAEFGRLATVLDRAGWQLHAHAIGDRAVRTALDGYEAAMRANGRRGNRHTVTHLQLVHPDDYKRFARLGVVACMQLQWATRNAWTLDALLPYIGKDRHRLLYPARSLERNGAFLSGGSDWPVDPLGSWNQIRTAIDRQGHDGTDGALYPEREALSRTSSLRMHTAGSAHQLRLEGITGSLTRGRAADLVILDRDVTRVPVREIGTTQVRLTLVNGKPVYEADSAAGKALRASQAVGAAARPASLQQVHGDRHKACGCGSDRSARA